MFIYMRASTQALRILVCPSRVQTFCGSNSKRVHKVDVFVA